MLGIAQSLDQLPQAVQASPQTIKLFLDSDGLEPFFSWLESDNQRAGLIGNGLEVVVFRHQIVRYADYLRRRRRLRRLGVTIDDTDRREVDYLYERECRAVYFYADRQGARDRAEFLVLARRRNETDFLSIVSQHRSFQRVPYVNAYFNGLEPLQGTDELPPQFDIFNDLNLHPQLILRLHNQIGQVSHGATVLDAVLAWRDHIRVMSGTHGDGYNWIEQIFNHHAPQIAVNPLTDPNPQGSQLNEQKGFQRINCGVVSAIRNPLAHEGPNSLWARSRFPDNKTVIKYLCLFSILCERADAPLNP